jgi:hypothetical protein
VGFFLWDPLLVYFPRFEDRLCGLAVRVPGYRTRGPGVDSRRYQIFWELVGLERGSLSLVRIIEELLERTIAAPVYKTEINGRGDPLRWPRDTLYPLKLALTSPTSGGRSVGIVRWWAKGHGVSFPWFKQIKVGLWDYPAVCVFVCLYVYLPY